jgi:hypothetical protein
MRSIALHPTSPCWVPRPSSLLPELSPLQALVGMLSGGVPLAQSLAVTDVPLLHSTTAKSLLDEASLPEGSRADLLRLHRWRTTRARRRQHCTAHAMVSAVGPPCKQQPIDVRQHRHGIGLVSSATLHACHSRL